MKQFVIEELRKKKGLSRKQLAEAIGVSDMQVYRWENIEVGDKTPVTEGELKIKEENLKKLADFFECSTNDLFNVERKDWLEVAKNDGIACANSTKINANRLSTSKKLILEALKANDRDRVTELLLQLSVEAEVEFEFFYRWLAIKDIEKEKEYVYAFLASAIKTEE